MSVGFLMLIGGGAFGDAMQESYGWSPEAAQVWDLVRWPGGLLLEVLSISVLLKRSPRRRQPGLTWLALGSSVAVLLSMAAAGGLAVYVQVSESFNGTYGPLGGVFAMLIWALASAAALFFGAAVCAQLEALRAGLGDPVEPDPGSPRGQVVAATAE